MTNETNVFNIFVANQQEYLKKDRIDDAIKFLLELLQQHIEFEKEYSIKVQCIEKMGGTLVELTWKELE